NLFVLTGIAPVRRSVEKVMFGPTFRNDRAKRAVVEDWIGQVSQNDRKGIRKAVLGVVTRPGVTDEVGKITAPTLVMVGADDIPPPVKRSRTMAALIPGARLEIVPYAGHSSTIEQPEAITALIRPFLADVDARLASPAAD